MKEDKLQLIEEEIKKKEFEKVYTSEGPEMEKIEKELNELKKKYVSMLLDKRT